MAVSHADSATPAARRLRRAAFACVALICAGTLPAAGPKRSDLPIQVDAASLQYDIPNNRVLYREVIITQGDVRLQADEATANGADTSNSEWTFRGNVRIKMERGSLQSDDARVTFADNRIARAVITGSPAAFEQVLENGTDVAKGRAGTIEYDVTGATVRLLHDAYLTDGHHDIKGESLVYNIAEQRVSANAEEQNNGQRVIITLTPDTLKPQQPPAQGTPPR
jgi:lipopolysaccharide transport protein LptA